MPLDPKPSDLTIDQLRSLWLTNRDPDIRRVIEEVAYRRREAEQRDLVMHQLEKLYVVIHQSWREEVGDTLVALECMKSHFSEQRQLRGEPQSIPGAPRR